MKCRKILAGLAMTLLAASVGWLAPAQAPAQAGAAAKGKKGGGGPPRGQPQTDYGTADIARELFGVSGISPREVAAGEQTTVRLVYRPGALGVAVGGKIKFGVHQHDMSTRGWGIPRIGDPKAPDYLSVTSSNPKATLTLRSPATAGRENPNQPPLHEFVRARKRYVYEAILSGDRLRPGDTVTVSYGDRSQGGPGVKAQRGAPGRAFFFFWVDALADGKWHEIDVERILVHGAKPAGLVVQAPSTPKVGEQFEIVVRARDEFYNVAPGYRGTVNFVPTKGLSLPKSYTFTEKDAGVHTFSGLQVQRDGTYFITVRDTRGGFEVESNPVCPGFYGPGRNLYWGDLHGHSELSDGDMTAQDYYSYGRNVARLDFCSLTDHVGQVAYFAWDALRDAAQGANRAGRFVAIPGWELGGGIHRLAYYFSDEPPASIPPARVPAGYGYAREHPEEKVLFTVHYQGEENFDAPANGWTAEYDPVRPAIEAYSWWRNSVFQRALEKPGEETEHWESLYLEALSRGLHVGIYGGGDNHLGQPGAYLNGLTGVIAPALSRDSIYQGLRAQYTIAATGIRPLLGFEINDQPMGATVTSSGDPALKIRLIGTAPIRRVDVYRQGRIVRKLEGGGKREFAWSGSLAREAGAAETYYFIKAYQEDGQRMWSSPIWVKTSQQNKGD